MISPIFLTKQTAGEYNVILFKNELSKNYSIAEFIFFAGLIAKKLLGINTTAIHTHPTGTPQHKNHTFITLKKVDIEFS